jgi:peptidoglycan/LPS O-acetylase OafA/YrhL
VSSDSAILDFMFRETTRDYWGSITFIPVIQYLRAVAALSVLLCHLLVDWLPQFQRHCMVLSGGVDIFFVISSVVACVSLPGATAVRGCSSAGG